MLTKQQKRTDQVKYLGTKVTAYVILNDDESTIERIEQEVEVGLPDGCPSGHGMYQALRFGMKVAKQEWDADIARVREQILQQAGDKNP